MIVSTLVFFQVMSFMKLFMKLDVCYTLSESQTTIGCALRKSEVSCLLLQEVLSRTDSPGTKYTKEMGRPCDSW